LSGSRKTRRRFAEIEPGQFRRGRFRAKRGDPKTLERVPIKWNHLIDKNSLKIKELEHGGTEKGEQLFRDMLSITC
jgi:hypothetical protein